MNISITREEFEAICFAEDQVSTALEAADDDYAHDASVHINHLLDLIAKFRDAAKREQERKELYELAKEMYPNEEPVVWKLIARKAFATQERAKRSTQI